MHAAVRRARVAAALSVLFAAVIAGCEPRFPVATLKATARDRAERRAYDGAPPVIPHDRIGVACTACHDERGMEVSALGFAPANPHHGTAAAGAHTRCAQCHVHKTTAEEFASNRFEGVRQEIRGGDRLYPGAPPVIPHAVFQRENCAACHTGPAAREEIRCSHPERARCRQCHAEARTGDRFAR